MDSTALFTGLLGMVLGAAALHSVMKRDWWALTGVLSIGAVCLLGLVTEGPRTNDERTVVTAVMAALLACFIIAVAMRQLRARRAGTARRRL